MGGGNRCQPPPAQEDQPASQPARWLAAWSARQPAVQPASQRAWRPEEVSNGCQTLPSQEGVCNGCQPHPSQDGGLQSLPIPSCGEEEEGERGGEDEAVEGEVEEAWEEEEQGEEEHEDYEEEEEYQHEDGFSFLSLFSFIINFFFVFFFFYYIFFRSETFAWKKPVGHQNKQHEFSSYAFPGVRDTL